MNPSATSPSRQAASTYLFGFSIEAAPIILGHVACPVCPVFMDMMPMSERTSDKIRGGMLHGNVTIRKMEAAIENLSGQIVRADLKKTTHLESSKTMQ